MTGKGIVVLGSANMDLVVQVARHPEPGETVFGDSWATIPGGKGLNQAVAAARAGAPVSFAGVLGRDEFGDRIAAVLAADGIDTSAVRRCEQPTGTAHITVNAEAQNSIVVVSGANRTLSASALDRLEAGGVGWLLTQLGVPLATVSEALDWCRARDVRSVLTPAPVLPLDGELLHRIDLLVPNEIEACQLSGAGTPDEAAQVLSRRCGDVVVTLGAAGSLWARGGEVLYHEPAVRVRAVDTTAAGDTFVGVLVTRLAEGAQLPEAMRWAAAGAAIGVGRAGASSSMPTRAEIEGFLA